MQSELPIILEGTPVAPAGEPGREESFSVAPTPSWLIEREIPWESPNQPGEHALFLLVDTQYSWAQRTIYERSVRRINTPEAVQKLSHVDIDYDPKITRLAVHEVKLWRGGQFQSFADPKRFIFRQREAGLEAQILHGRISAILLLDDVRPGDTIECAYSFITTHELEGRKIDYAFLRERTVRTMAWFVALHLPPEEVPAYRQSDGLRQEPEVYDHGGEYVWVWSGKQEEAPLEEGGVPIWESQLCWGQVSGFQSWGEVARLLAVNWEPISCHVEETRAWVAGMGSEGRSLEERVSGAIRWVQDRVRYQGLEMGLGGVLPSSPDEVFRRRYGDCKDKSLFLCSVLRELGVEAHPLLVHTVFRGGIREHLPSMSAFNHAIVTFVLDGKRGFADPTALGAGGGAFGQCLPHYEQGLCVDAGVEDLLVIPHVSKESSAWWIEEEFFLAPHGSRSMLIQRLETRGFEADLMRARLAMTLREGYAKDEAKDLQRFFPDLQPLGHVGVTDDRDQNHLLVETRFEFSDWGQDIDANFRMFNYSPRWLTPFLSCPAAHPARRRNFVLRFPLNLRHEVIVHGEFTPAEEQDHFIDSRWFRARSWLSWEDKNTVKISYSYQNLEKMVEAVQVPEFLRKFSQLTQVIGCQVRGKKRGFRREKVPDRPLAEGGEAGGEAGFEPRLTGEALQDADQWFVAARGKKPRRKPKSSNPFQKALPWLGLGVFMLTTLNGILKLISDDGPAPVSEARPASSSVPAPAELPQAARSSVPAAASRSESTPISQGPFMDIADPELARADAAVRRGDVPSAMPDIEFLEKKYPGHPTVLLLRAMAEIFQGKTAEARVNADLALKKMPGHPMAIALLARADLMEKKYEDAEKRFLYMTQFFPNAPEGWSGLSFIYGAQGRYEESEKATRQVLRLKPADPDALKQIMFLLMRRNAVGEGELLLKEAIAREPANAWLHGLYSIYLFEGAAYPASMAEVEEALRLQSGAPAFLAQKARVLAVTGHQDEAYELAKLSVSLAPFDASVNSFAARAFADCRKYPEAVAAYTRSLEAAPQDYSVRNALGYVLLLSGDLVAARRELEKTVSDGPDYVVGWENLLNVCKQTGDTERAAQCEKRIAELKGTH